VWGPPPAFGETDFPPLEGGGAPAAKGAFADMC